MNKLPVTYIYHHVGIPTKVSMPGERYSEKFKMYTTVGDNEHRIQWYRFE